MGSPSFADTEPISGVCGGSADLKDWQSSPVPKPPLGVYWRTADIKDWQKHPEPLAQAHHQAHASALTQGTTQCKHYAGSSSGQRDADQ